MAGEDNNRPAVDGDLGGLINSLIEEATKEQMPPRLRALARLLEQALDRNSDT